jgi:Fe2+ transport system protein B
VYVLLTAVLFPSKPATQALAFLSCYALGALAGLISSFIARRTIAKGTSRELAMELPTYKRPSLRTAALSAWDRGVVFVKKAGTIILAISIVLWWMSTFPKNHAPSPVAAETRERAAMVLADTSSANAQTEHDALMQQAEQMEASYHASQTFAGRLGKFVQPVFAPLGYDWRLSIGVMTSFAAREVFATTMAVVATGSDDIEDQSVVDSIWRHARIHPCNSVEFARVLRARDAVPTHARGHCERKRTLEVGPLATGVDVRRSLHRGTNCVSSDENLSTQECAEDTQTHRQQTLLFTHALSRLAILGCFAAHAACCMLGALARMESSAKQRRRQERKEHANNADD